ncbi:MAG: cell division protein SepF [Clostridiales Family XIII bacterium]|jgi:FtsZ-interacting cell division protein YlmF|nr:cell division protein SepF [Clostridiales Family XIII bacterium]
MSLFDKIKVLAGVDDDVFDERDYLDEEPIQPKPGSSSGYGLPERNTGTDGGFRSREPVYRDRDVDREREWDPPHSYRNSTTGQSSNRRGNVVEMSSSNTLRALTRQFNIVVVEPKIFEESTKLVDNLKSRKPVIINLEKVETDTARKIFDFMSGATYALSGNMQKITNNIFVFMPENVSVSTSPDHDGMTFGAPGGNPWNR